MNTLRQTLILETVYVDESVRIHLPEGDLHLMEYFFIETKQRHSETAFECGFGYAYSYVAVGSWDRGSVVNPIGWFGHIKAVDSPWYVIL